MKRSHSLNFFMLDTMTNPDKYLVVGVLTVSPNAKTFRKVVINSDLIDIDEDNIEEIQSFVDDVIFMSESYKDTGQMIMN